MGGKGGRGHKICVICGVTDRRISDSRFFAKFPLNENRCKEWLRAIGKEQLVKLPIEKLRKFKNVCSSHFRRNDIIKAAKRVKNSSIPTLNLKGTPLTDAQLIGFPQPLRKRANPTSNALVPEASTSREAEPMEASSAGEPAALVPEPSTSREAEPKQASSAGGSQREPGIVVGSAAINTVNMPNTGGSQREAGNVVVPATVNTINMNITGPLRRQPGRVVYSAASSTINLTNTDLTPLLGNLIEKLKETECEINHVSKIDAPLLKKMLQGL